MQSLLYSPHYLVPSNAAIDFRILHNDCPRPKDSFGEQPKAGLCAVIVQVNAEYIDTELFKKLPDGLGQMIERKAVSVTVVHRGEPEARQIGRHQMPFIGQLGQ